MTQYSQHIALWTCPRSRSTAITRAFEQLDDCCVYDEPLAGAYLLIEGQKQNPPISKAEIPKSLETDHKKVIEKMTGEIPNGSTFLFSKNLSQYVLPTFEIEWLKKLKNVFLIRNPQETILSYWKTSKKNNFTIEEVGWMQHYNLFKKVQSLTKETPLIIDSDILIKDPPNYCKLICDKLGVKFDRKMLSWEASPEKTRLLWTKGTTYNHFYKNAISSSNFINKETEIDFPEHLVSLLEECLPLYEELSEYRLVDKN